MIVHDFFPTSVRLPDRKIAIARVAIDTHMRGVILVDGRRGEGVQVVAQAEVVSVERNPDSRREWLITTSDGEVWACRPGGGCGCGNPLRRFDPEPAIQAAFA